MPRHTRFPSLTPSRRTGLVGGGLALLASAALVASCGGGGGSADTAVGTPASIDSAGVDRAIADLSPFVAVCSAPTGGLSVPRVAVLSQGLALLTQQRLQRLGQPSMRAQALGSTAPADVLGDCGGRYGYTSYSHVSGVTTATLAFSNYCTLDGSTGNRQVVNGSVSFVDTATPTSSGPISTRWEGRSSGLSVAAQQPGSSEISRQTLAFDRLVNTVGVPGGAPTAAAPDRISAAEFTLTNNTTGKVYRQTGYEVTLFETATGGEQMSVRGRGYRASGEYFDVSTPTPIVTDDNGAYLAGALRFAGANDSQAVATLVPGATLQATLVVNGTRVSNAPACN